jgi:hypothetical protein
MILFTLHPTHHLHVDFPAPIFDPSGAGKSDRHSPHVLCSEQSRCWSSDNSHWGRFDELLSAVIYGQNSKQITN